MKAPSTLVEPGTVRLERLLPGPLERVWAYITEPQKRATWICGGTIDLRVGGKMHMEFDNNSLTSDKSPPPKYQGKGKHTSPGVVTRLEPMRVFAHTWTWESGDTEVTYELAPRGKDVLLTIVHKQVQGPRRHRQRDGRLGRAHRRARRLARPASSRAPSGPRTPSSRRNTAPRCRDSAP